MEEEVTLKEILERKVIAYYTDIWHDIRHSDYQRWLNNFTGNENEKLNALYMLSKFTYFGNLEIRAMLKALYRDLYKYPIIEQIRINKNDTTDEAYLKKQFKKHRDKTRFLGVGNPSESGVHMLYYFRQENKLSKRMFVHAHELFKSSLLEEKKSIVQTWADDEIDHIVFIDDFCGDGSQAIGYIKDLVKTIKDLKEGCKVDYYVLVAMQNGLKTVKDETNVDNSKAIFVLDDSFKCFADNSRYFVNTNEGIDKDLCRYLCDHYGKDRYGDANSPFGFNDNELLLSFFHNTPNNTHPIFWTDKEWYPIFMRSIKIY